MSTAPTASGAAFTTVMNWQSHKHIDYEGVTYGQREMEFEGFPDLPEHTLVPMEVAVSGPKTPWRRLYDAGWRVRNVDGVTLSVDSFRAYIRAPAPSLGLPRTRSWEPAADGSAPADCGFRGHVPCGEGLLAVSTLDEAAEAIDEVHGNDERDARRAREIAMEYFDARRVLRHFLAQVGIN